MRKKLLFLLSVCLFFQLTYAQDNFTVIKVTGNIVIERTGSSLGIGTSFAQNENLLFKIPDSRAAVINPQRGRFLLTSQNLGEFKNSKSNFLPAAGKISTRGFIKKQTLNDLKDQFEGSYVILDETRIIIDSSLLPMNSKKFFYVTYDYNNKPVNKKLAFNFDTLIIKKNELFIVDGKEIPDIKINQMKLMYLEQGETYNSMLISSFTPVFPDNKTLTQEVKIILDQMEMNPYKEKLYEVSSFFQEFYGKIDETSLKIWLKENFSLRQ